MSAQINNENAFRNFLVHNFGGDKLTKTQAHKFGIDNDKFEELNDDNNLYLELDDEILKDGDLYAQFATMYIDAQEKKAESKDHDKEKEEQNKVKDKNGAGAA